MSDVVGKSAVLAAYVLVGSVSVSRAIITSARVQLMSLPSLAPQLWQLWQLRLSCIATEKSSVRWDIYREAMKARKDAQSALERQERKERSARAKASAARDEVLTVVNLQREDERQATSNRRMREARAAKPDV